jgi:hypothetical protein
MYSVLLHTVIIYILDISPRQLSGPKEQQKVSREKGRSPHLDKKGKKKKE